MQKTNHPRDKYFELNGAAPTLPALGAFTFQVLPTLTTKWAVSGSGERSFQPFSHTFLYMGSFFCKNVPRPTLYLCPVPPGSDSLEEVRQLLLGGGMFQREEV